MPSGYDDDRLRELKAFDDTKAGVKGLVDAGVTAVPRIFHHPPDPTPVASAADAADADAIPVIDLARADADRDRVVAQVRSAAESVGFFQVVNHGVPARLTDGMLAAVRRFNERPAAAKAAFYTRDAARRRVRFNSNFDLFESPAANWRDTLFCQAAPDPPAPEELPADVRGVLPEYAGAARRLASSVLELLSSALGLETGRLGGMGCADGVSVVSNYYPPCPEPEATVGTARHSDPAFLTVLLQDGMGGLQALLGGRWVDVPPVAGALVVNVGDLLELVSNGRMRSVEHRVVANRSRDAARVSVAAFCNVDLGRESSRSGRLYGPIAELTAGGDPPRYRSTTVAEFLAHYDGKGLDGRPALHHFRLPAAASLD
ncbi:DIBOA-glucoside dioxygenase BX6 isoform X1 [Oryza sativa Japonica Group]|jgi:isopenicillin N synthase-like dioxygenase|uniref:Os03g0690500 protein n=5 Tax=Oryza TaxID=4527 RepID=Q10EX9_ORYSJ|nr:DIBOA-glucoside dioxygenase BX6 [Oryza sativa Japonica Group]EAY91462.1 hypothetical protein OsI_13090 [Oryza sativa Indica Group]AAT81714.1 putative oxygenase [Oryza sativa Japonica Group]ABF98286.1 oxidoreductase, 2OG-Fe oxygenase family protein, expressed [Oryza sativa Japonica Group]EAZ28200.1 hypothetical protein OsJ_12172 [Oryza sativa Japonica Group]BAF12865.2 Os03g0690500 [Oryza sativa Japonica Group]|eukprot:NP_001050951.2 Os03g0690500 [Oryza sativa Japonica Group]